VIGPGKKNPGTKVSSSLSLFDRLAQRQKKLLPPEASSGVEVKKGMERGKKQEEEWVS